MFSCFRLCSQLILRSARRHTRATMSTSSYSFDQDIPSLDGLRREIDNIVALPNVKPQLEAVVKQIAAAEKQTSLGYGVAPPKPFHMAFVGNSGTGKSMVAQILGKLFYLGGVLPSYNVTEMRGMKRQIKVARGGILLVDVHQNEYDSSILEEIASAMDEGETSVIFAGPRESINRCISLKKELHKKIAVMLKFDDFTCQELATMQQNKINDQALELHPCCSIENVGEIIDKETYEQLRSSLNAYLIEPILTEAKSKIDNRVCYTSGVETIVFLDDLEAGVRNATQMYRKLLKFSG